MESVLQKCMYCEAQEFGPGVIEPLCEKHLELTIFIWRLRKRGEAITAESIIEYMKRVKAPVALRPEEVPDLLEQMAPREVAAPQEVATHEISIEEVVA